MTREEIVEGLKLLEDNMVHFDELQNDKGEWIDVHELLFEAIQALSQEPCTDAVSREDAIKALQKVACYSAAIRARMIGAIEELPSVTPSRRKGHWIETEYHRWRCSVCREKGMSEWDNIHAVRTNFCPDCGAYMVEPQESEDKE